MASNTEASSLVSSAEQARPNLYASEAGYAIVIVGQAAKHFNIREDLLIQSSDFFRAALRGGFKETHNKTVTLKDGDAGIFEVFVHWLYFKRFPDPEKDDNMDLIMFWFAKNLDERLLDMYIFADKYQIEGLGKEALNAFYYEAHDSDHLSDHHIVNRAFDSLSENSPLCRLLVDLYCYYEKEPPSRQDRDTFSHVFMRNIWSRYRELVHKSPYTGCGDLSFELCNYHSHKDDQEKQACTRAHRRA
ncbi:Nn.00g065480.m01.CDS01 [Neocucurbitaria sp. VM-36]